MDMHFICASKKPTKARSTAEQLLQELNLDHLCRSVKKCSENSLKVFFAAKTHKPSVPLRAIVTEEGSWQKVVGFYPQRHLSNLIRKEPFGIKCSAALIEELQQDLLGANTAFQWISEH